MSIIHCAAMNRCLTLSGLSPALKGELMEKTLALVSDTLCQIQLGRFASARGWVSPCEVSPSG